MRGLYWPVFLIVAAVSSAAVWRLTPRFVDSIPPGLRDWCRDTVAKAQNAGRPPIVRPAEPPPQPAQTTVTPLAGGGESDDLPPQIVPAPPRRAARRTGATYAPQQRPQTEHQSLKQAPVRSVQQQPAAPAPGDEFASVRSMEPVDPHSLPSMKGVMPADPKNATWGVVNRVTELEDLQHNDLGQVAGGRFFEIERRFRSETGLMLIGNFTPKRLATTVQIPAENLCCLSGSPSNLDEDQRHALRMYYQLRGEALERKAELQKRTYDEFDNPVESKTDPMKDPRYTDILEQMKTFAARIVGLAF